jgi:Flp pilus assembly protein TadG
MRCSTNRRGATIVLVAMVIVVLVGILGLVIDFSRFYAYRTQMQTTADAASLAGALEVARSSPATAPDTALHYVALDSVDGGAPTVPRDSIQPVIWDFSNGSHTIAAGWTAAGVNAVRVSVTHAAPYTFGAVWQTGSATLHTTAIAAVGFVGATNCLKPWAVSYQTLLNALYPPAGSKPVSYNLTAADIQTLSREGPANKLSLLLGNTNPVTPGNIAAVQVDSPWSGNAAYKATIAGTCSQKAIGPGTWLPTDPGEGSGQTATSLKSFCDANGGTTGSTANFTCTAQPRVKMAVWDIDNGLSGNNLTFRVKYIAVFAIMGFNKKSGPEEIDGYFSEMASTGSISGTPSPVKSGLLVQ